MPRSRENGGHETSDESGPSNLIFAELLLVVALVVVTTLEDEVAPSLIPDAQEKRLLVVCPSRNESSGTRTNTDRSRERSSVDVLISSSRHSR